MTEQKIVSMKDLRFATIICSRCSTRVTLDLAVDFATNDRDRFKCPDQCPRCGMMYGNVIPESVNALQKVYQNLSKVGNAVSFSVGEEEEDA